MNASTRRERQYERVILWPARELRGSVRRAVPVERL
jgi:hypothetical protein